MKTSLRSSVSYVDTEIKGLSRLVVHDADLDGRPEFYVSTSDRQFAALTKDGQLVWKNDLDAECKAIVAADINRDGITNILCATDERIFVFKPNGTQPCDTISLAGSRRTWINQILVEDVDFDGRPELLVITEDGAIHIYSFLRHEWESEIQTGQRLSSLCVDTDPRQEVCKLYCGTQSGTILSVSPSEKKVIETIDLQQATPAPVSRIDLQSPQNKILIAADAHSRLHFVQTETRQQQQVSLQHPIRDLLTARVYRKSSDELLVLTTSGLYLFDVASRNPLGFTELWEPLVSACSAADVDRNGVPEIIVTYPDGLLILDSLGELTDEAMATVHTVDQPSGRFRLVASGETLKNSNKSDYKIALGSDETSALRELKRAQIASILLDSEERGARSISRLERLNTPDSPRLIALTYDSGIQLFDSYLRFYKNMNTVCQQPTAMAIDELVLDTRRHLIVGTQNGEIKAITPDGQASDIANLGTRIQGLYLASSQTTKYLLVLTEEGNLGCLKAEETGDFGASPVWEYQEPNSRIRIAGHLARPDGDPHFVGGTERFELLILSSSGKVKERKKLSSSPRVLIAEEPTSSVKGLIIGTNDGTLYRLTPSLEIEVLCRLVGPVTSGTYGQHPDDSKRSLFLAHGSKTSRLGARFEVVEEYSFLSQIRSIVFLDTNGDGSDELVVGLETGVIASHIFPSHHDIDQAQRRIFHKQRENFERAIRDWRKEKANDPYSTLVLIDFTLSNGPLEFPGLNEATLNDMGASLLGTADSAIIESLSQVLPKLHSRYPYAASNLLEDMVTTRTIGTEEACSLMLRIFQVEKDTSLFSNAIEDLRARTKASERSVSLQRLFNQFGETNGPEPLLASSQLERLAGNRETAMSMLLAISKAGLRADTLEILLGLFKTAETVSFEGEGVNVSVLIMHKRDTIRLAGNLLLSFEPGTSAEQITKDQLRCASAASAPLVIDHEGKIFGIVRLPQRDRVGIRPVPAIFERLRKQTEAGGAVGFSIQRGKNLKAFLFAQGKLIYRYRDGSWQLIDQDSLLNQARSLATKLEIDPSVVNAATLHCLEFSLAEKGTAIALAKKWSDRDRYAPLDVPDGVQTWDLNIKDLSTEEIYPFANRDGALMVNGDGSIESFGCRLQPETVIDSPEDKGTRHTFCRSFSAEIPSLIFVVSAGGPVTAFSEGKKLGQL